MAKKTFTIEEVASIIGVEDHSVFEYIRKEWVSPELPESHELDEEDLARARLITDLIEDMGVNDEAVSIILHLVDQIHYLNIQIRRHLDKN